MKIILASKSPRRRELLKMIFEDFTVADPYADENVKGDMPPAARISEISRRKAAALKPCVAADDVIIAADTMVFCGDEIFGKPKNAADAKRMLSALSGKTHSVVTAFTVIYGNKCVTKAVTTDVTMRKTDESEIDAYIAGGEPIDKAGAYAVQGGAAKFIEKINGDYFSVMGLPICALAVTLKELGIKI